MARFFRSFLRWLNAARQSSEEANLRRRLDAVTNENRDLNARLAMAEADARVARRERDLLALALERIDARLHADIAEAARMEAAGGRAHVQQPRRSA